MRLSFSYLREIIIQKPVYFLSLIFILSRIIFYSVGGYFDVSAFKWSLQLLDVWQLKNNLLQSVWYMHGQPPLFNLFTGCVLKFFSGYSFYVFQLIFVFTGWLHIVVLFKLFCKLSISKIISLILCLYFVISPAVLLYENFFYYTQFELLLVTISAWLLFLFLDAKKNTYGFGFFFSLAILILTRSMFHWFYIVIIAISLLILYPALRKKVLLTALLPIILTGAWFYKNYVLYDKFASSTWLGMNLSRIVQPEAPFVSRNIWFDAANKYTKFIKPDNRYPNVEVLHAVYKRNGVMNLNHIDFLQISDLYMQASVKELKHKPIKYFENVARAHFVFFEPSANFMSLSDIRGKIRIYTALYDLSFVNAVYRRLMGTDLYRPAFFIIMIHLLVAAFVLKIGFKKVISGEWKKSARYGVIFFMIFTAVYIDITGNFIEYGENNRFRFITIPTVLVLIGLICNHYLPWFRKVLALWENKKQFSIE